MLVTVVREYMDSNQKTVYDLISISKNPTFDKEVSDSINFKG